MSDLQKRAILNLKQKALSLLQKGKTFSYLYEEVRACRYFGVPEAEIDKALEEAKEEFELWL